MPRPGDNGTEISIDFSDDPTSKHQTSAQKAQLAKARETALYNRRTKLKAKLEEKLSDLRNKLGDLRNDQLERVVKHLCEIEDHHRSKLAASNETMNKRLQSIHEELRTLRKGSETRSHNSGRESVAALSEISSIRH